MKYKALYIGRNNTYIKDVFLYMSDKFDLISTSEMWEDISAHIKLFEPDVIICMHDDYTDELFSKLREIKRSAYGKDLPIVAVCDDENAERINLSAPELKMYIIKRPVSIQILKQKAYDHVFDHKKLIASKKAAEEEAMAAAAAAKAENERKQVGITSFSFSPDKKNILIIDDDKTILKMLKAALEDDYNVTAMAGSKMAYKFLETKPVDLILLDYEMPIESGPEVFKRIRGEMGIKKTPIVFLTGVSESSKIKEVLQLGPQGYLLKPIDVERLGKTIKELVN